jgi:hypothetical protein
LGFLRSSRVFPLTGRETSPLYIPSWP